MCKNHLIVLPLAMLFVLASCNKESEDGSDESTDQESPESIARENDRFAAEELALSDKGVDQDGEKVWKQEAREYFDRQKNPMNRTFELPPDFARDYIEKMYQAGATRVWVTGITEFEIAQTRVNMSDSLVVVLPPEADKRAALFKIYHTLVDDEELALKDIGQKYIFFQAD